VSSQSVPPAANQAGSNFDARNPKQNKIQHVVVIVQENRTVDNLFQFLPGARTQPWGYNSRHQKVALLPVPLTAPYDMEHSNRIGWRREYNHGAMDGFDRDPSFCRDLDGCPIKSVRAYGYVPQSDVQPYYNMAEAYTFADEMFETSQGPSFPAHQYLLSGTSTTYDGSPYRASENAGTRLGGCDSPPKTRVFVIDQQGNQRKKVFPCFNRSSIFTLLDAAGISWKYYQWRRGPGAWNGVDALRPIWSNKPEFQANVVYPPSKVLTDISNGTLASVVFVTPTGKASDHALHTDGSGPSWVASVVNAIGSSQDWKSTAIVVTWDDWGGWYDHVKPTIRDSYELGFRVPMIVISPYAKTDYVSHVHYEFGSILKFVEETFALPSLGTTDKNANDLSDCFNLGSSPRAFRPIAAMYSARYFLMQPPDSVDPDDD
jgi:phospholipase C